MALTRYTPSVVPARPTQAQADAKAQIHVQLHQDTSDAVAGLVTHVQNLVDELNAAQSATDTSVAARVLESTLTEKIQDAVGAMLRITGATGNYDDTAGTYTIAVPTSSGGSTIASISGLQAALDGKVDDSEMANVLRTTDLQAVGDEYVTDQELEARLAALGASNASVLDATVDAAGKIKLPGFTTGPGIQGVHRGDWTASTRYNLNDLVTNSGATYRCINPHTSVSTFVDSHWAPLPAVATPVANVQIATPSWTAPASDQSYVGLFTKTASPVEYPRLRRGHLHNQIERSRRLPFGQNSVSQALVTTGSPLPGGHVEMTGWGYPSGSRVGITLDRVLDVTNAYLRLLVSITNRSTAVGNVYLYFATDKASFDAGNSHRFSLAAAASNWLGTEFRHDAVHPALCTKNGNGADWSRIGYMVIQGSTQNTSVDFALSIPYIEVVPTVAQRAAAVLWHDDSTAGGFEKFLPLTMAYNAPITFAAALGMTNNMGYITSAQHRFLQEEHGAQIASHAATMDEHKDLDADQVYAQAMKNRAIGYAIGVTGMDDFAWWGNLGTSTANYRAVKRAFRAARWNTSQLTKPEMLPPAEPWMTKAILAATTDTFEMWKELVDNAIATKGMAQFVFHNDFGSTPTQAFNAKVLQLLDYLDSKRDQIDVVTFSTALEDAVARVRSRTFPAGSVAGPPTTYTPAAVTLPYNQAQTAPVGYPVDTTNFIDPRGAWRYGKALGASSPASDPVGLVVWESPTAVEDYPLWWASPLAARQSVGVTVTVGSYLAPTYLLLRSSTNGADLSTATYVRARFTADGKILVERYNAGTRVLLGETAAGARPSFVAGDSLTYAFYEKADGSFGVSQNGTEVYTVPNQGAALTGTWAGIDTRRLNTGTTSTVTAIRVESLT